MKVQIQDLNKQNIGQIIVCEDLGVFGTLDAVMKPTTDGEFPNYTVTIGGEQWEMEGDDTAEVYRSAVLGVLHRQHMEFIQGERALRDGDMVMIDDLVNQRVNAATSLAVGRLEAMMKQCMEGFEGVQDPVGADLDPLEQDQDEQATETVGEVAA